MNSQTCKIDSEAVKIDDERCGEEQIKDRSPDKSDMRHDPPEDPKPEPFGVAHDGRGEDHCEHENDYADAWSWAEGKSSLCLHKGVKVDAAIYRKKDQKEEPH